VGGGQRRRVVSALHIQLALIALAGALGGMGRVFVAGAVDRRIAARFPWGTLAVNLTGCAAIGALAAALLSPGTLESERTTLWLTVVGGFLGSYTTVSSFSLQTLGLLQAGHPRRALANIALTLAGAVAATAAAYAGVALLIAG
jgi:CrcB protein